MSLYRKIDDWFLGYKTRSVRYPHPKIQTPDKFPRSAQTGQRFGQPDSRCKKTPRSHG